MAKTVPFLHALGATTIAVLTIALLSSGAESLAARAFSDGQESTLPCLVLDDPVKPVTARPNTVCRGKLPESPVVEYRFNACGHRTASACSLGAFEGRNRIVLLGSSLVEGFGVPVEASFAGRLPLEMARGSHVAVDVYNEAMQWGTPRSVALRMDEALREKPVAVIWPVTPFDVQNASLRLPYIPNKQPGDRGEEPLARLEPATPAPSAPQTFSGRLAASYAKNGGLGMLTAGFDRSVAGLRESKAVFAAQHFMYANQHEYVKHFLGNRSSANYLFVAPDASQADQLNTFEKYYSQVSAKLQSAGIPLFVILMPSHPQVSLLSGAAGDFPEADPRALDRKLQDMVHRHGDHYVDIFDSFATVRDPADYFYAVDEHANVHGHDLFAKILAARLGSDAAFMKTLSAAGGVESGAAL